MLVEHYEEIFPIDLHWQNYDEGITDILEQVRQITLEVKTPTRPRAQTREKPSLPSKQMSTADEKSRKSWGLSRFK